MRIIKSFVGWLCFLSLIAFVGVVLVWAYATGLPYLDGGVIHQFDYPYGSFDELTGPISKAGISGTVNDILRNYVLKPSDMSCCWYGVNAISWAMLHGGPPKSTARSSTVLAAVMDMNGRVVASYPGGLIGRRFPLSDSTMYELLHEELHSTSGGQYTPWMTGDRDPKWEHSFQQTAFRYAPAFNTAALNLVRDRKGRPMGVLIVGGNKDMFATDAASSQYTVPLWAKQIVGSMGDPSHLRVPIRPIVLLLIYLVGLPVWAGMDAGWRGMRPFAWGILVAITGWIGLLAYLMARLPAPGRCWNCGERILGRYRRCPSCGVSIQNRCPICRSKMKPGWQFCPRCHGTAEQGLEPPTVPIVDVKKAAPAVEISGALLEANVTDAESGLPVARANVTLKGPSELTGLTGDRGTFDARRLRPGKYTVRATHPSYQFGEADVVMEDESQCSVGLILKPLPGRVAGRVLDKVSGRPVGKAHVSVDSSRFDNSTETGAEGGYALPDLPHGPYTLIANADGFNAQTRLVEVQPGQQAVADFLLTRKPEPPETVEALVKETSDDGE